MINCVIFVLCDFLKINKYFFYEKNVFIDKWFIFVLGVVNENCNIIFKCILILCVF